MSTEQIEKGLENLANFVGELANAQLSNSMIIDAVIECLEEVSPSTTFKQDFEARVTELMEKRKKEIEESRAKDTSADLSSVK